MKIDYGNIAVCFFGILVLDLILLFSVTKQPAKYRSKVEKGELLYLEDDSFYFSSLNDYCIKDDYLYVLFQNTQAVKIYDKQGKYLATYIYYDRENGQCSIDIEEDYVYLQDRSLNYYVFQEGKFVRFIEYTDYDAYYERRKRFISEKEKRQEGGEEYYKKSLQASIFAKDQNGGKRCVVRRPWFC